LAWLVSTGLAVLLLASCAELLPHERAFEVTVDLTAEGQRRQITRRILCEGEVMREIGIVTTRIYWRAQTRSFGERLPSGAGVMMVTPSLCWSAFRRDNAKDDNIPIAEDHVPLIGWTDNVDSPTIVEAYIWPGYFSQPNARVRYHGMTAKVIEPHQVDRSSVGDLNWFGRAQAGEIHYSLYAAIIPSSEWKKFKDIAAFVSQKDQQTALPREMSFRLSGKYRVPFGNSEAFQGVGLPGTPYPDDPNRRWPVTDQQVRNLANFHPMFRTDRGFEIRTNQKGYLTIHASNIQKSIQLSPQMITLVIGNETHDVKFPLEPISIYEPSTQTIFYVLALQMMFPNSKKPR
jgi:hypothetical protein